MVQCGPMTPVLLTPLRHTARARRLRASGVQSRRHGGNGRAHSDNGYGAFYFPGSPSRIPHRPAGGRAALGPRGGDLGADRRERGVHKAPANEVVRGAVERDPAPDARGAGRPQPGRRQLHPLLPARGHPRLGRAHAGRRGQRVALPQRAAPVQHDRGVHRRGTRWIVFEPNDRTLWKSIRRDVGAFLTRVWRDGALMGATPRRRSSSSATRRPTRPRSIDAGQVVAIDRHRAGQAGRVRRLPHQPVRRPAPRSRRRELTGA